MKNFISLLLTFLSLEVCAQITTASLRGVVENISNEPLVGVTITLEDSKSGLVYYAVADRDGRFALHGIRPSDNYVLLAEYIGYKPHSRELQLRVGNSSQVSITLEESLTSVDEIMVVGSTPPRRGDSYTSTDIKRLPSTSRSLYDLVRLTPQAMTTKNGGISYGGVANRYNSFMVNGVANNDMYGLSSSGTNGGLSNANPVSLDAIEQLEVAIAPFDVRMSGFGGGMINAITKSGTNSFEGSAYLYYNNQDFYGTTPGRDVERREKLPEISHRVYGASLGGAILRDRLYYFVSGELNLDTSPSSYYMGYEGSMLDEAELKAVAERYKSLTGYDGGGYGRRDVEQKSGSLLAKLDWYINSDNHFSASYSYLDAISESYTNSLSSFTFNGSGYANFSTAHHLSLALESRLSERVHNSLKLGYSRVSDGRDADRGGDLPSVIIKNSGKNDGVTINIGNNRYAGVNTLTQDVVVLTDDLIFERGAHSFTLGMHHEFYNIHNRYIPNALGSYTYNSVADFERDMAAMYEYNYSDPTVTGSTTWGPHFKAAELNLYLQDSWDLGRGLNLAYGVRATLPLIFNTPTPNESFNGGEIAKKYGVRVGDIPQSQILFSPRAALEWRKPMEQGELSIKGGVGLFTGQVPFVWVVNNYSNTGVEQKGVRLVGRYEDGEVVESAAPFVTSPSPTILSNTSYMLNTMNKRFRYPQNLKASLSAEYRSDEGWRAKVEALYTKTIHNAVFRNLAIEPAQKSVYAVPAGEGGEAAGEMPAFYKSTSDYSAVYYMDNTSQGYSYSLSGELSRNFDFGVSLSASYIFSHSYSVCDVPSTSSSSNWSRSYDLNLNSPELSFSAYDVPHKVSLAATYHKRYAKLFDVSVGVVYQMVSGQRYTPCFGETVDYNGDGVFGVTPLYIPTEAELQRMKFADAESAQKWNDYILSDSYLRTHRGSFAERNALQAPMEHTIDLHLAHGFYFGGKSRRKLELSLDVMNFANLLSRHWGSYYYIANSRLQPVNIVATENGEAVYRYTNAKLTTDDILSRWRMQFGARVIF